MALSAAALEVAFLAELFQGGPNRYPREGRPPAPGLPGDKARNQHDRERSTVSNVFTRVVNALARVWPLQSPGPLFSRAAGGRARRREAVAAYLNAAGQKTRTGCHRHAAQVWLVLERSRGAGYGGGPYNRVEPPPLSEP